MNVRETQMDVRTYVLIPLVAMPAHVLMVISILTPIHVPVSVTMIVYLNDSIHVCKKLV